jgi:antitoxin component of RelBE/YafQ-DinJ toxin-antitoxin module
MDNRHWYLDCRVTHEEKSLFYELARRRGLTMSALLRSLLNKAVREQMDREDLLARAYPQKARDT